MIVFIERSDACATDAVCSTVQMIKQLSGIKAWRQFAALNGVLCCVYTRDKGSLGRTDSEEKARELLTAGVDIIMDATLRADGLEARDDRAVRLRAEAYRHWGLSSRQRDWILELRTASRFYACWIFFVFGLMSGLGQIAAKWIEIVWQRLI